MPSPKFSHANNTATANVSKFSEEMTRAAVDKPNIAARNVNTKV